MYFVVKVCSVHSSAWCGDAAYKARLFSQHHNGQGSFSVSAYNCVLMLLVGWQKGHLTYKTTSTTIPYFWGPPYLGVTPENGPLKQNGPVKQKQSVYSA